MTVFLTLNMSLAQKKSNLYHQLIQIVTKIKAIQKQALHFMLNDYESTYKDL